MINKETALKIYSDLPNMLKEHFRIDNKEEFLKSAKRVDAIYMSLQNYIEESSRTLDNIKWALENPVMLESDKLKQIAAYLKVYSDNGGGKR